MENKGLLYQNKYLPTDVFEGSRDTEVPEKFKQYYQDRKRETEKQKLTKYLEDHPRQDWLGRIPQHILTRPDYHFRKFLNNDLMSTNKIDFKTEVDIDHSEENSGRYEEFRYVKPIRTLVQIDSRNRDTTFYPFQNSYVIDLPRVYCNVKRVSLRHGIIPNSFQLIKDSPVAQANNLIEWEFDDADPTIYTASITPGNYEPSTLASEIESQMNAELSTSDGELVDFDVSIDQVTDIVEISSFKIINANNVMSTDLGDPTIVTVTLTNNHNYETGDVIVIESAFGFAGIPTSELNGTKTITKVDNVTFTFPLSTSFPAQSTETNKGGSVAFKKGTNFSLLFSNDKTIADVLGFPLVDTAFSTSHANTSIGEAVSIENIYPLDGIYTAIVLTRPLNILSDQLVRFQNITQFTAAINEIFNSGTGFVVSNLTATDFTNLVNNYAYDQPNKEDRTFKIPIDISGEQYQNLALPLTINNTIPIEFDAIVIGVEPIYPFITAFYPFTEGGDSYVALEFTGNHGLIGQSVIIPELDPTTPYTVSSLTNDDKIALQAEVDPEYDIFDTLSDYTNYAKIIPTGAIPFERFYSPIDIDLLEFIPYPSGYSGNVLVGSRSLISDTFFSSNNIVHKNEGFEIVPLDTDDLNDLAALKAGNATLDIENVNFKVNVPNSSVTNIGIGGSAHDGPIAFTRTNDNPIILSGDEYIFLCIEELGTIETTTNVPNVFGILELSGSAGTTIYNGFINSPKVFEPSPLRELSRLHISFRDRNNALINFNDVDHSFAIEIVEFEHKLKYNDFSSVTGDYSNRKVTSDYYH